MNNDEKFQYVRENFLHAAIQSIEMHRRYWNPTIPRTLVSCLSGALRDSGYEVIAWEIPPQWEHVFYLIEDAGNDRLMIKALAEERYRLMSQGMEEALLPI